MHYKIIYAEEVFEDIQQGVEWYNSQQKGLGKRFFTEVKQHLNKLKTMATGYTLRYDDVRCLPIKKFPYMIHFRVITETKTIKVIAIFNTARDPQIWTERTKEM